MRDRVIVLGAQCQPAPACENDRVPQKVVDQVVVKVAARKEEGKRVRPLSDWLLYGTAAKTHTATRSWFYNSGKISRGGERGFGFYGLKGSSALIMPHLKLPCHTLAQFRLAGSFSSRRTNPIHACKLQSGADYRLQFM